MVPTAFLYGTVDTIILFHCIIRSTKGHFPHFVIPLVYHAYKKVDSAQVVWIFYCIS